MQDPIGSFLRIRELYLGYLDTAFRIGDENVAAERRRLLRAPGSLCTEPLVEPLPRYANHELALHDLLEAHDEDLDPLPGFDTSERRAFVELVLSGLFPSRPREDGEDAPTTRVGHFNPYTHQVDMLRRGTHAGSPGIVTSGTGSGKTEAFLLPLLAALAKEAKGWSAPEAGYLGSRWWHDPETGEPYRKDAKPGTPGIRYEAIPPDLRPTSAHPRRSPFRLHRSGERRRPAVRALVLYPMNALVEDQLIRLRKSLDSREAREVMDREFDGNRIFFGRYTGKTPVTGNEDHPGFRELLDRGKEDSELDRRIPFHTHARADDDGTVSLRDVRETELSRRQRRQRELFDWMVAFEDDQRAARRHADGGGGEADASVAPSALGGNAPFMFPSVDGSELISRWDMQETPPDILITNVSMLSAILTREVDQPILEKTRAWLEEDDSYFYLVLDELHLQRGSAGTEVSYLIRLLLDKLGLTREENRHKLRILASSASLPDAPEDQAQASANYLWDMFGRFGLPTGVSSMEEGRRLWLDSIVAGEEVRASGSRTGPANLRTRPYVELLEYCEGKVRGDGGSTVEALRAVDPTTDPDAADGWRAVARDLGVVVGDAGDALPEELVPLCVRAAGSHLAGACWDTEEGRKRAATVRQMAWSLFRDLREGAGEAEDVPYEEALRAVRALLFVRGCGDGLGESLGGRVEAPSFRLHTFFRSIEGLYAPAWKGAGVEPVEGAPERRAEVGQLSIDREGRKEFGVPGEGPRSLRQLELLYCECCGELFFGGMRARASGGGAGFLAELLPHEPQLDGLPDTAASQRFEELSYEQYAIFWPTNDHGVVPRGETGSSDLGRWRPAMLEREMAVISRPAGGPFASQPPGNVMPGFLYERGKGPDKHGRRQGDGETHVPYACPKCGTDYYRRSRGMGRLSPVRNFRTGFAKTTQLLATELFDAQRTADPKGDAKLVSFADSRQDAARAALDVERNHHQDLRREVLIANLRRHAATKRSHGEVEGELAEAQADLREAAASAPDVETLHSITERLGRLQAELQDLGEPSVALSAVVEDPDPQGWDAAGTGMAASPLIADMVRRGVHPYDEAGLDRPVGQNEEGKQRRFDWNELFELRDGEVFWRDDPAEAWALPGARRHLVRRFHRTMTDVFFNRTYFSPEESGLGYATVYAGRLPSERRGEERQQLLSALMRVVTDSYRYEPNPYRNDDNPLPPWTSYGEVQTRRVKDFAKAVWGESEEDELELALRDLGKAGHAHGIVRLPNVRIKLAEADDPYWRCGVCSRVHLHRGAGVCTRCFRRLPEPATGTVGALRARNFLAAKVLRASEDRNGAGNGDGAFRLHCEELTGQTEDPALRQRRFQGIFLPRSTGANGGAPPGAVPEGDGSAEDPQIANRFGAVDPIFEAKETIDLLAVTTTMEVGIDVGPLQAVLQSNMPPQRFNYQQRVGRAGRRGQAFSMALTICRTRSHDTYYFHEPRRITGDVPPTPFLTKGMTDVAQRFVRKRWLIEAFTRLRHEDRSRPLALYPGDLMSPPDIHGEFVPVEHYLGEGSEWPARLRKALDLTRPEAERFGDLLELDGQLDHPLEVDADHLLRELGRLDPDVAQGLAHGLAETGLLPMYGMPTRARNLYLGVRLEDGRRPRESTIDRDLDVAIYEFAPGATVVKDKREHLCVGLTPELGLPRRVPYNDEASALGFQGGPFGETFRMSQCGVCSAWARLDTKNGGAETEGLRCAACGAFLSDTSGRTCVVPNGFRTDFAPGQGEGSTGSRHRAVQAEGRALELVEHETEQDGLRARARLYFDPRARTYRLNRGPVVDGEPRGFGFESGSQRVFLGGGRLRLPRQAIANGAEVKGFQAEGTEEPVWLAAPKTTDSLYLTPSTIREDLSLHRLPARSEHPDPFDGSRWQGVRAAALSATFLIVDRAASELDIDPSELEVLEPRPYGAETRLPLLQMTDELVNGAGFCRNLHEPEDGVPRILRILRSMLVDADRYPLERLYASDHRDCDTACYRCLLRYGNQQYHGLLDWQLGLTYLRAMLDPTFACGLDGDFGHPGLERWKGSATLLAHEMALRFRGETGSFAGGAVPAFRIDVGRSADRPWVLVAHPLWDWHDAEWAAPGTLLARAAGEASREGTVYCWDTFNLARRQVQVREWIKSRHS